MLGKIVPFLLSGRKQRTNLKIVSSLRKQTQGQNNYPVSGSETTQMQAEISVAEHGVGKETQGGFTFGNNVVFAFFAMHNR